jgi:predicted N-acetyltransferase YhbS
MERGQTLVAEHGDRVVGMVSRAPDPNGRIVHLVNLYVDPDMREHGLGRSLVESAEFESRVAGARVSVAVASAGAEVFYERLGYRTVAMVMEKVLR